MNIELENKPHYIKVHPAQDNGFGEKIICIEDADEKFLVTSEKKVMVTSPHPVTVARTEEGVAFDLIVMDAEGKLTFQGDLEFIITEDRITLRFHRHGET